MIRSCQAQGSSGSALKMSNGREPRSSLVLTGAGQVLRVLLGSQPNRRFQPGRADWLVTPTETSTRRQYCYRLIEGESGVGKELVARQIHQLGRRRHGPFVAINCGALVETLIEAELFGIEERTATGVKGRRGKFEHADGGTLFLDEVSDLSLAAQAKLLRVVQDLTVERVGGSGARQVNTRIVAATNRPLAGLVERGVFRADLFYRLSGVEIRVPPLRSRKGDILELAQYFLARHQAASHVAMSPAAIDALVAYDWPGNVRELERMVEGAIATADSKQIGVDDLPVSLRGDYGGVLIPAMQLGDTMRAWGSRYARLVLERHAGNKRKACRVLDISYHTLNSYLRYKTLARPAAALPATPVPSDETAMPRAEAGGA
jgi:two-component system response regulator HydG